MKSQVSVLLHVVRGLFRDIHAAYPALKGSDLDFQRIALYSRERGLAFFTLDLPNLDALLLQGLETGRLSLSGPLSKAVSKRTKVPRLLSGLWLRVFDRNACLRQEVDPLAILFIRQLSVLGKKLEVGCTAGRLSAAYTEYHNVERNLRNPSLRWDLDHFSVRDLGILHLGDCLVHSRCEESGQLEFQLDSHFDSRDEHLLRRCQQVADIICQSFGFFEPVTYSLGLEEDNKGIGFKHGPGAVAERQKNWEKSEFTYWPRKLSSWFPFSDCAFVATSDMGQPVNHEPAARLIDVPKTSKGPRLIAAEPVAHQWCQQIVWRWLREKIESNFRGYFIDFRRQHLSGEMVIAASLDRHLATVDLSSASDRLSCWTVERMFRMNPSLLSSLHAVRTRSVRHTMPNGQNSFIKLKKFASQGTATTFPVQSIVFLIIALASCFDEKEPTMARIWKLRNHVRVFGDDIVIPRHGYAKLCRLMNLLQLKVNDSKSYVHGQFRESCGTDAYAGYDVTPVKPRFIVCNGPKLTQAVIDTVNNLFKKGFWHASNSLAQTLPMRTIRAQRIVSADSIGFSGFISFSGSDESHLVKRWNPMLQRVEVRVWGLSPKSTTKVRGGYASFVDFVSRRHDPWIPRVVSEYRHNLQIRDNLRWEPLNWNSYLGIPSRNERSNATKSQHVLDVVPDRFPMEIFHGEYRTSTTRKDRLSSREHFIRESRARGFCPVLLQSRI